MVVVVVAGGGGCAAAVLVVRVYVLVLYFLFSRQRNFFSLPVICVRFRGCPVVLDTGLSVSARYQRTRVLLHAWRLLLLRCISERHKFQNRMQ